MHHYLHFDYSIKRHINILDTSFITSHQGCQTQIHSSDKMKNMFPKHLPADMTVNLIRRTIECCLSLDMEQAVPNTAQLITSYCRHAKWIFHLNKNNIALLYFQPSNSNFNTNTFSLLLSNKKLRQQ